MKKLVLALSALALLVVPGAQADHDPIHTACQVWSNELHEALHMPGGSKVQRNAAEAVWHNANGDTCRSSGIVPPPPPPPPPSPPPPPPVPPPPPPPPPPTNGCTDELAAGGDLSTFLGTLTAGDVGCLHAGEYTDGCAVSWTTDAAITLRDFGDGIPVVHTSIGLAGDNLTVHGLTITGIAASCGGDMSGFTVQGANDTIEFNRVIGDGLVPINPNGDISRHGILTNTSSTNTTVHGNYIEGVGSECNLDHGIYFQKSGRITRNVFSNTVCGYGIHLYSGPSGVVVAENTSVGSQVRSGILINCSTNCTVVNNIFANNATAGITARAGTGLVIDNNITWNNGPLGTKDCEDSLCGQVTNNRHVDPLFSDTVFHVGLGSPAIDTARTDFAFYPDLDGFGPTGLPDLGAYER